MSPDTATKPAPVRRSSGLVVFDIAWRPAMRAAPPSRPAPDDGARSTPPFSAAERVALAHVIDEVRRCFQADGGDVTLVSTRGNTVYVRLTGTCADCGLAAASLGGLQQRLIEAVGRPVRVRTAEHEPGDAPCDA